MEGLQRWRHEEQGMEERGRKRKETETGRPMHGDVGEVEGRDEVDTHGKRNIGFRGEMEAGWEGRRGWKVRCSRNLHKEGEATMEKVRRGGWGEASSS